MNEVVFDEDGTPMIVLNDAPEMDLFDFLGFNYPFFDLFSFKVYFYDNDSKKEKKSDSH